MARESSSFETGASFLTATGLVQSASAMMDRAIRLGRAGAARKLEGERYLTDGWRLLDAGECDFDEARRVVTKRNGAMVSGQIWTELWERMVTAPLDELIDEV